MPGDFWWASLGGLREIRRCEHFKSSRFTKKTRGWKRNNLGLENAVIKRKGQEGAGINSGWERRYQSTSGTGLRCWTTGAAVSNPQVASLNGVAVCGASPPQAPLGDCVNPAGILLPPHPTPPPPPSLPQASVLEIRGGPGWHERLERSPNTARITQRLVVFSPLCIGPMSKDNTHIPVWWMGVSARFTLRRKRLGVTHSAYKREKREKLESKEKIWEKTVSPPSVICIYIY